jgi:hypothetical protein
MTDNCKAQFGVSPASRLTRVWVSLRTTNVQKDLYEVSLTLLVGAEAEPVPQPPRAGTGADSDAQPTVRTLGEGVCWICVITSKLVTR